VGEGTASELRAAGAVDVIVPAQGADSEALLALAALRDVAGRRVAIFSGVGGRDLLATELAARGAVVHVVPCYERVRPETPVAPVRARIASGSIAAVTATSGEGVRNLYAMLAADAAALAKLPHVVPHERIAQAARDCGVVAVHVCGSGDAAMVSALIALLGVGLVAAGS
jgi:uroporphyrinogen-III synthase